MSRYLNQLRRLQKRPPIGKPPVRPQTQKGPDVKSSPFTEQELSSTSKTATPTSSSNDHITGPES